MSDGNTTSQDETSTPDGTESSRGDRTPSGSQFPGGFGSSSSSLSTASTPTASDWILIAGSAAVTAFGLILALCFRRRRR